MDAPRRQSSPWWLLRGVVAVMLVGAGGRLLGGTSAFAKLLWLDFGWPEAWLVPLDRGLIALMWATAVVVLVAPRRRALRWLLVPAGLWLAVEPLAHAYAGVGGLWPLLSPPAQWNRPLALAALGVWAVAADDAMAPDRNRVQAMLRWGAVMVFAAHGIEALLGHPQFIDYLVVTYFEVSGGRLSETGARQWLFLIGAQDLVVAVALAHRPRPRLLVWAAVWGLSTAAMRLVYYGPIAGLFETLVRSVNGGGILVLWWLVKEGLQTTTRRTGLSDRRWSEGAL